MKNVLLALALVLVPSVAFAGNCHGNVAVVNSGHVVVAQPFFVPQSTLFFNSGNPFAQQVFASPVVVAANRNAVVVNRNVGRNVVVAAGGANVVVNRGLFGRVNVNAGGNNVIVGRNRVIVR